MMTFFRKAAMATALTATVLGATTMGAAPAAARDYYRHNDNTAAVAIGAGVIGLALGAIIASSNDDDRYRDRRYDSSWQYRDGYYWDRDGGRHSRDDYYEYQRRGWNDPRDDWRRGYNRDGGDFRRGY